MNAVERLLTNRITIENESDTEIVLSNLTKHKTVSIFNCKNIHITITNTINKVYITSCTNITVSINKLYSGMDIVHCNNIQLVVVYSPMIQIDMSNTICIHTSTIIEMFIVYCMTHTIDITYYHNDLIHKYELWVDAFANQIITHIDPESPNSFNTTRLIKT